MKKPFTYLLFCFLFFSSIYVSAQAIIRVDAAAGGMNDGTSWEHAYTDLQDALSNASANDTIWIAEGTYRPDTIGGTPTATFSLQSNLVLLGGFPSGGGNRDPETYPTVLSGDLNGDDVDGDFDNFKSDNVNTVVTIGASVTNATILDGLSIRYGHADGNGAFGTNGGGIYSIGEPIIRHCTFEHNYAAVDGGAIFQLNNTDAALVLVSCQFSNNSATLGAALYQMNGLIDIAGCSFTNHHHHTETAPVSGGTICLFDPLGGIVQGSTFEENVGSAAPGMLIWRRTFDDPGNVMLEILDCDFNNNVADLEDNDIFPSGLMLVTAGESSIFSVRRCAFNGNSTMSRGGGLALLVNPFAENASILIDSCDFIMNTAVRTGSALYTRMEGKNFNLEVTNCHFLQNVTINPDAGALDLFGSNGGTGLALVDNCWFEENVGGAGGAIQVGNKWAGGADMDFEIRNSHFEANEALRGGAIALSCNMESTTDLLIEDCTFARNKGTEGSGTLDLRSNCNTPVRVNRCVITEDEGARAVYVMKTPAGSGQMQIENSLITNNNSESNAILVDSAAHFSLLNCTIADNLNTGLAVTNAGLLELQNTILHNNGTANFEALSNDVTISSAGGNLFGDDSFMAYADASDLLNEDPLFAEDGDSCDYYQLTAESQAPNRGVTWADAPVLDWCGNDRVFAGQIDIGALESDIVSTTEIIVTEGMLSPIPAADFINVQFPEGIVGPLDVRLFDAQGKFVRQQTITNGEALGLTGLANGLYLIKVDLIDRMIISRFVKQ